MKTTVSHVTWTKADVEVLIRSLPSLAAASDATDLCLFHQRGAAGVGDGLPTDDS